MGKEYTVNNENVELRLQPLNAYFEMKIIDLYEYQGNIFLPQSKSILLISTLILLFINGGDLEFNLQMHNPYFATMWVSRKP